MAIKSADSVRFHLQQYEPDLSVPTETNIQNIINGVEKNDKPLCEQALINFLVKEYQKFDIEELKEGDKREKLWKALIKIANETDDNDVLAVVFTVFRIVSRDQGCVNKLVTTEWINLLIRHIGLNDNRFDYSDDTLCKIEEGQKVVWNIIFNSKEQGLATLHNGLFDKLIDRIKLFEKVRVPDIIKFYDTRLMFYLSACYPIIRDKLIALDGLKLFTTVLKVILKESAESTGLAPPLPAMLDDKKADTACETLKVLFNVTINPAIEDENREEKLAQYRELVRVLRSYLLASTVTLDKTWQLRNDIVNLLTNMPAVCYTELLTPVNDSTPIPKTLRFEDLNMTVIYEILMFLEAKFKDKSTIEDQLKIFSPVLSVLFKASCAHRSIRKYLRSHILPPLKEMEKRPEETDTLRGHLCKLLTTPITQVRDLAAELLFVLCKCNVSRMIKYTGYGNAAGLFAQRGLLGGKRDAAEADYSSGSEGSETEEYSEQKHLINPVLGCVEKPHADPMAGMTDEQKEHEVMRLVKGIDGLIRTGIILPGRVGADGKPHALDHVLQLRDRLTIEEIGNSESDSD